MPISDVAALTVGNDAVDADQRAVGRRAMNSVSRRAAMPLTFGPEESPSSARRHGLVLVDVRTAVRIAATTADGSTPVRAASAVCGG